jgi:two-component system cell cycle sensor histidine kinase/response regulator CckA
MRIDSAEETVDFIRRIADELPVGVWVARAPSGELIYANRTFAEIMGSTARNDVAMGEYAEPYGICTRSGEKYPEEDMPFARCLRARETIVVDDIVIHRRDGGRIAVRATAKPLKEGDEITAVMIAFIDISREVLAEKAQRASEARAQAEQRLAAIGRLAGGIAHDFNNLLSVVRATADLLADGEQDPERRADLRTIDDITESAVQLTRALLAFAGGKPARMEPVDIDALVLRTFRMLERALDRRMTQHLDLACASLVDGDAAQLAQVFLNFATNARDAMPDGGHLFVTTRATETHVVIEVEDEGPGVDEALRARVFEPYFSTKPASGARGSGLGLATVYGIVQTHRGLVEVNEGLRGGALFRVVLPRLGPREVASDAVLVTTESRPRGSGTLLIVDDEDLVRGAAARALSTIGYTVLSAASGEEGVSMLRAHQGTIRGVLLDVVMPGMNGSETHRALRAIAPELPIVMTSGLANADEALATVDRRLTGFIAKPWGVRALAEEIERVFAGTT